MRRAPPTPPGMPHMNANPAMPAFCAACATRRSGTAVPARTLHAFNRDLVEAAAEPHHHARHAAVAHDQIGTEADDHDGDVTRQIRKQISEVGFILRHEQDLCRTADAKPRQPGKRLVAEQTAAQLRHRRFQIGHDVGEAHALPSRFMSSHAPSTLLPASRSTGPSVRARSRRARGSMPALPSSTA